jgi:Adaptin N terminal region
VNQAGERPHFDYLESCLRHKAEMVILEAARAITELSGVTSRELTPAITVLQLFLSSSKPVLRFAAVRTLNKVLLVTPPPPNLLSLSLPLSLLCVCFCSFVLGAIALVSQIFYRYVLV